MLGMSYHTTTNFSGGIRLTFIGFICSHLIKILVPIIEVKHIH